MTYNTVNLWPVCARNFCTASSFIVNVFFGFCYIDYNYICAVQWSAQFIHDCISLIVGTLGIPEWWRVIWVIPSRYQRHHWESIPGKEVDCRMDVGKWWKVHCRFLTEHWNLQNFSTTDFSQAHMWRWAISSITDYFAYFCHHLLYIPFYNILNMPRLYMMHISSTVYAWSVIL